MRESNENEKREPEKSAGAAWDNALKDAYEDLQKSPTLSQAAREALKESESRWEEFRKADSLFFDSVFGAAHGDKADEYKQQIVQDRVEQLVALRDGKLTAPDSSNSIDRKLSRCLAFNPNPGSTVVCLGQAANDWQILKNQTLSDLANNKPAMRQELAKDERAWQEFAEAEDRFLGLMYPDNGPSDTGSKRLKAEVNAMKDRALEVVQIEKLSEK